MEAAGEDMNVPLTDIKYNPETALRSNHAKSDFATKKDRADDSSFTR